ncbi:hypothetical protein NKJ09_23450 [Mesorhizobium sp. M0189]|uniref:hypothetical protein n=1 Tax=Mesorhizobium sp. M0189 TaxID=2956909 RepID=UPI00333CE2C2
MIAWLDHRLFGNGHGLKSPYFDDVFYWLSDTKNGRRENGQLYTFSGWFGAQLQSFQWKHPLASERRRLCNREFTPLNSERRWFRVRVSWSWIDLPKGIDETNAALRQLQKELSRP